MGLCHELQQALVLGRSGRARPELSRLMSHCLLPLELELSSSCSSVNNTLLVIEAGETDLTLDLDDDPLWADAIASPECEYWVMGACNELKSLTDLKVFVLVPCSEVLHGQHVTSGWPVSCGSYSQVSYRLNFA